MDVISVLKVIDQIKKTQSCTASVLCRIGCILEYLLGLLKKNDESDQKVIKDLSDLKEIVDKAVSDLSGLTVRVSTLEYRMDIEIPAKFHEQLLLIQNNSKEIDTNRINIADNLNSINLLWDALAATDTSIGNWGDIVAGINNRIDNIMSLTTNLQTQINNLSTRITELSNSVDTRISNINTTLQDHSGRIENLEDEDRNIHDALDDIRADIAELTGGSGTLSQDISELQNRVSVLESSLANLDNYVVTSVLLEGARFTVNLRNLSTGAVQTSVLDLPIASEQYPGLITAEDFTKLEGIEEGAQVNVQSDWNESAADSGAFIKNKPSLAAVATSGNYNDLNNKPSIPAPQVNSDWNASSGIARILNKPNLAPVATSGSYNDLTDKPSAPEIPDQVNADWNATSGVAQILNKPNLATVATSGQYNDLEGKPAIPPAVTLPGVNVVDSFPDSVSGVQDGTVYIVPGSGSGGSGVTPSKPYIACGYVSLSSAGDVYQTIIHLNNDYLSEASVVAVNQRRIHIDFTLASGVSRNDIYDSFNCALISLKGDIPAIINSWYVFSSPKAVLHIEGTSDSSSYYMLVSFFIPLLV
jgi:predicted  nucleic acid-binding Zn-ribbon protein|uniref:Chromosome segregation ATPase n=1 Tax=CrAss-like virus sp. ctDAq1 TaxID=2826822 RepID=A0A8S5QT77_9CAUD|nr:MAG TPA: chromosome segregation ATPase [CrAss-like virus sp. ctDAq1]